MPTRADLRTLLRRRLEDTTATPLWDDAALNDLLVDAVRQYGMRFPAEETMQLPVTDGATSIAVDPEILVHDIVAVRDGLGRNLPQMRSAPEPWTTSVQSWRWWNGALILSSPALGGTWEIDYFARRELAGNDVDTVHIRAGDEEIVILMAASGALLRRAVELSKRGVETGGLTLTRVAERHARDADDLMRARRRRATGGWLRS